MKRKVIGIAGYIGAGKTEAGRFFESLGAFFIDADEVVNYLYQKEKEGYRKMVNYFGEEFLRKDGELDRQKLAKFVFSDKNKLTILNHLIHPLVANEVQKRIDASHAAIIVLEATYFDARHLGRMVNEILWIECQTELLEERVLKRQGMKEALVRKILKSQVKPEGITMTVENNGSLDEFHHQLKKIWEKWV